MGTTKTILALNCAIYLFMFGVGLITPLLPAKIMSYSGSAVQVGGLASAFACSYILFQIPMGLLADRFGYTYFIAFGYLLCGVSGMMYLSAHSATSILAGRLLQGLGEAPLWALAPALLSLLRPTRRAVIIGWYNASLHIGLTSGSIFCFASRNHLTEKQLFGLFIALCTIAAVCVLACKDRNDNPAGVREKTSGAGRREFLRILRDYRNFCVLLGITLYGIGYGAFLTNIPSYLLENNQFGRESAGWLFIGFYIGISLAQLTGGYCADAWGRIYPMVGGLFLFSGGLMFFPLCTPGFAIVFLSLASFGLGLFLIGSMATLNDQAGKGSKGLVSGIFYLFWGAGYFAGPLVLGFLGEHGHFVSGFTTLGIAGTTVGVMLLVATRMK